MRADCGEGFSIVENRMAESNSNLNGFSGNCARLSARVINFGFRVRFHSSLQYRVQTQPLRSDTIRQ